MYIASRLLMVCLCSPEPHKQSDDPEAVLAWVEKVGGTIVRHADSGVSISLQLTEFTDADVARLKVLPEVYYLDLSHTPITDAAASHIKGIKGLRKLSLHCTALTDKGLKELTGLKGLEYLELQYTKITDEGIPDLENLRNFTGSALPPMTSQTSPRPLSVT
jgi:hypothetical protein